jgi:predicted RNA methylase
MNDPLDTDKTATSGSPLALPTFFEHKLRLISSTGNDTLFSKLVSVRGDWFMRQPLTRDFLREMREELPDQVNLVYSGNSEADLGEATPPPISRLEAYLLNASPSAPPEETTCAHIQGALSLREAAACLRDQVRTKRFLVAIERAIEQLADRFPDGELHVIDAGTGPLPVLAIAAALANPRVRVTALELNPHSLTGARAVINELNLSQQITLHLADATNYTPSQPAHLLISETMDTSLLREPIAQIFNNLSQHVIDGGIRIPESVQVLALLFPEEIAVQEDFLPSYCIVERVHTARDFDWKNPDCAVTWRTDQPLDALTLKVDLREASKKYANQRPKGYYLLTASVVQVLDDIYLRPNSLGDQRGPDSLICQPLRATCPSPAAHTGAGDRSPWHLTALELKKLLRSSRNKATLACLNYRPGDSHAAVTVEAKAAAASEKTGAAPLG